MEKQAVVLSDTKLKTVKRYLPQNYKAYETRPGLILIYGDDFAGYTMQGYVLPRLGSGLIAARELV
jgi:hypothetical protein